MTDDAPHQSEPAASGPARTKVLVVDDHPDNLALLQLILQPLDLEIITAQSGHEALRVLLEHEVAVIVLDVRMPGMDGFETAAFVKRRERTRNVPIIFLTALANDREQALSGYEAGAVDYIEKPVEPVMLRAKVATFAELYASRVQVAAQAELLREAASREAARELAAVREQGEREFRDLAEAMPTMVFALDAEGTVTYRNARWGEYLGDRQLTSLVMEESEEWEMVHDADRPTAQREWSEAMATPSSHADGRVQLQVRLLRHDGAWLWHDVSCTPRHDADGRMVGWVGTATEVDRQRRSEASQRVLAEAGAVLGASTDVTDTFVRTAELVVPSIVDWCSIDVVSAEGEVVRVALRVDGSVRPACVERLGAQLDATVDGSPTARLLADGSAGPQRVLLDRDGLDVVVEDATCLAVPLVIRGARLGVLTLAVAEEGRRLVAPEHEFARALANRLASALDASRLYRSTQERAQAAEVLDAIGDGVALVDPSGVVRLWNPAAAAITGVPCEEIIDRHAVKVLPSWEVMEHRVPVGDGDSAEGGAASTVPLTMPDGRDVWLSVTAMSFTRGVAYAFRDLTEERVVERMKSDFVATVSHELRTPLASIYGAAMTLQRTDLDLDEELREQLLDIVSQQSEQLAGIVEAVLTASKLDSGTSTTATKPVDARGLVGDVVDAARSRAPQSHELELVVPDDLPQVAADPGQLRQVLDNLMENAVKYSPGGGTVVLTVSADEHEACFAVRDHGIGITLVEQRRIFEKFYRVDADMAQGIGGTGLGLFIVRELVRRMAGRIDVTSSPGRGSTFTVHLPLARAAVPRVGASDRG